MWCRVKDPFKNIISIGELDLNVNISSGVFQRTASKSFLALKNSYRQDVSILHLPPDVQILITTARCIIHCTGECP